MARFVVDASVILAYVLREGLDSVNTFFESLDDGVDELIGPHLLRAECTSVIHEQIEKGRVASDEVPQYIDRMLRIKIRVTDNRTQFTRAVELARQFGHAKAYDMQYLAAAIAEGVELVTIDGGMRQAAINIKHPVRFLR
jgi:predicted nucleic acid-binding protein